MNSSYRVVFNAVTGVWQAVSETARGRSKSDRSASCAKRTRRTLLGLRALPALKPASVLATLLACSGMAQAQTQYWDGGQSAPNGTVDGGSGTWDASNTNWTDVNGAANSSWADGFAVFQGAAGDVIVAGTPSATGLQFVTDGYRLVGSGGLKLVNGSNSAFAVRVDPGMTATIDVGLSGTGTLDKRDSGTLVLNGANSYTGGTTLNSGTLVLGHNNALGSGQLNAAAGTFLDSNGARSIGNRINLTGDLTVAGSNDLTLSGLITGTGGLVKNGLSTLTLNGNNTYSSGTTLNSGTLVLGHDNALGSGQLNAAAGTFLDSNGARSIGNRINLTGDLTVASSNDLTLNGLVTGAGGLVKNGASTLTLSGNNTYSGGTTVNAGTLGGRGSLSGAVTVASGATLAPGASTGNDPVTGSLTVGSLTMDQGSTLAVTLGAPGANFQTLGQGTSVIVTGNLVLNGVTLDVRNAGSFGPGLYRLFDYGGTLTMTNGGLPPSTAGVTVQILTSARQINLISTQGMLYFWNANNQATSTTQGGGTGTWSSTASVWTDATGSLTTTMSPQPGFAIFAGAAGTVTVDGSAAAVRVTGLQFASDGYQLAGDALTFGADASHAAPVEIRVGDGSAASSAWTATLNNEIAGSDGLKKTGDGTLVLAGVNSYSGGTRIEAGTLALGTGGSLATTGAVALTASGTTFDISSTNTAQTIVALQGVAGSSVLLGNQKLTLGDAASTTTSTFDGSLSGTASARLDKQGSGTLTLAGDSSAFAGSTTISGGTLALAANAQLGGALTVASGATLTGTGTVGNANTLTLVQSGATVAPGDAVNAYGTLQVAGDLVFEAGSTYRVQVDPSSSASSRIDVDGSATLAGGVLHVGKQSNAATDFQVGKTYTILHAGSLSGKFDTVDSNYAYLDTNLGYSDHDVTLELKRKSTGGGGSTGGGSTGGGNSIRFADLAESSNQAAAANGIESLGSGELYNHVLHLPNGAPAPFFSQVSGDTHASLVSSLVRLGGYAPSISQRHLQGNLTASMRAGAPVAQSDGPLPASAWPSSKALPAWAELVGHRQTYNSDGNAARLKQNSTGLFVGMDEEVAQSGWRMGGSLGYTQADGTVDERSASSKVKSYSAAVYGGKSFGTGMGPRINVMGGLAYTWHDINTERRIASLGQTLQADYSSHTTQLFAEVGYAVGQYDKMGFEPFVGLSVGQQRNGSFQERGGFAALQGESNTDNLASTTMGLRMHSDFKLGRSEGRLRATVGWRHAFGDVESSKNMAFAGGQNFTVAGAPLARNTAVLGLEADIVLSRSAALVLGYRGEVGGGQRDHSASMKLRWAF